MKEQEYSILRTENNSHTKVGEIAEKVLKKVDEKKTSDLAERISEEGSSLSEGYIQSLLTDGSEYYIENYDLNYEKRPEGGGGNHTYFWRFSE